MDGAGPSGAGGDFDPPRKRLPGDGEENSGGDPPVQSLFGEDRGDTVMLFLMFILAVFKELSAYRCTC